MVSTLAPEWRRLALSALPILPFVAVASEVPAPDLAEAHAALALYATLLKAASVQDAAQRLVRCLVASEGCTRVALGLREGAGTSSVLAVSGLSDVDPHAELIQRLCGAMDEAIDQARTLTAPTVPAGDTGPVRTPTDDDWIRIEHEALRLRVGGSVATVPLGGEGEVFGAVQLQWAQATPPPCEALARLEARLVLAAPLLHQLHTQAAPWRQRLRRRVLQAWQSWRQPTHRRKRQGVMAAGALLAVLAVAPLEHRVHGNARVEGAEQRVLVAPTQGFLKSATVRPGDRVAAGAVLAELMERDLELERERWSSQLTQHENAYAAAMARADRGAAGVSMARVSEAQAQLALVGEQLGRSQITAPFDAVVIQGDLSQSIGAPVKQGDTLFTLATQGRYRVIVAVDETEVARVQPGQAGVLMLSSLPWDTRDLVVERITPLAKAVDGRNVFEVQARLTEDATADTTLRPGLQGHARLVVGRMPPLWAWGRAVLDRVRVAWWTWVS